MKLSQVIELVDGELLTESADLNKMVKGGFGADLMSDVLMSIQPDVVLLTGLCNMQVVRTANIADVAAIIFVRRKRPSTEIIDLANQEGIPLITTHYSMFESCGRLFQAGLPSLQIPEAARSQ